MTRKKNQEEGFAEQHDAAAPEGAPEATREAALAEMESKLTAAEAAALEAQDKLLRLHAEMENLRRRTQREAEDARRFAVEKFATALLDVFDNLERALSVPEGNEAGLREGVQLTLNSWQETMGRFGLERIEAAGGSFDPHRHEALAQVPHTSDAGTVIAQHVAGYSLNGRLIRPAKVIVSSGPAQ